MSGNTPISYIMPPLCFSPTLMQSFKTCRLSLALTLVPSATSSCQPFLEYVPHKLGSFNFIWQKVNLTGWYRNKRLIHAWQTNELQRPNFKSFFFSFSLECHLSKTLSACIHRRVEATNPYFQNIDNCEKKTFSTPKVWPLYTHYSPYAIWWYDVETSCSNSFLWGHFFVPWQFSAQDTLHPCTVVEWDHSGEH